MITLSGSKQRYCDGVSRRSFLRIGTLGVGAGALTLADLLRAEAQAGGRAPHKSVIVVYLCGGPPHLDMVDLKPEAPVEIRGDFRPIRTNVPGIQICEHLPRLARMMDKFALIRALVGGRDEHSWHLNLTGYTAAQSQQLAGGRPSIGSYLSKLAGPVDPALPPYVNMIPDRMGSMFFSNPANAGFLGREYGPFKPEGEGVADMLLQGDRRNQLEDRQALLQSFDSLRRDLDATGTCRAMDEFTRQAFGVLSSSRLAEALDVAREYPRLRDRYGRGSPEYSTHRAPLWNDQLLVARRLVEAGVRCVTVCCGYWDNHVNNFSYLKDELPRLDQVLSALVQDLHDRGLDKDVSVVAWGEMGRTPRINDRGGRDHWPAVMFGLLAGGGMQTGQVIGSTSRFGEAPKDRPVHVQDVFATLYHNLGINARATVTGRLGRPVNLLDRTEPIKELIG